MNLFKDQHTLGLHILRLGLAALYLWFGFSQLIDGASWVSWVPIWASDLLHMPPAMIVLLNGLFEVVLGAALALNLFVRPVAFLLFLHLTLVTYDIGLTAIGMRDFALTLVTLSLALLSKKDTFPATAVNE